MLSETKCFSILFESSVFSLDEIKIYSYNFLLFVLFQLDIYFLEATWTSDFKVYSRQGKIKLCRKYMNAIFGD